MEIDQRAARWASLLLERYGVICRDILSRETLAPAWRELAPVFRRLEARGEIRGGRFITGVSGEQFALPQVVEQLRALRESFAETADAPFVILSAADPLNLIGILTNGERVPANRNTKLVFQSGRHLATYDGGEVEFHETVPREDSDRIFAALTTSASFRQN